jgi:pyruvate dehydrogenase E2 component (dihydrolipoamide acetyltransferase)
MSVSVSMPQLGESVTEGTVTRWLKREGEHVSADEPLLEVSTDKVDTEIPSPVSGVLRGITVAEDETVAVGAQLAVIDEEGAEGGSAEAQPAAPQDAAPRAEQAPAQQAPAQPAQPAPAQPDAYQQRQDYQPPAPQQPAPQQQPQPAYQQTPAWPAQQPQQPAYPAPSGYQPQPGYQAQPPQQDPYQYQPQPGGYQGYQQQPGYQAQPPPGGYQQPGTNPYQPAGAPAYPPAPPAGANPYGGDAAPGQYGPPPGAETAPEPAAAEPADTAGNGYSNGADNPYVTPLVRKLATENGVDLATVTGTGVGGRIRKQDVLDAARSQRGAQAAPAAAPSSYAQAAPAAPPAPAQPAPAQAAPAPAPQAAPPAPAAAPPAAPEAQAPPARSSRAPVPESALRGTTERMSRARQVIAQRMVESLQTSAQLTTVVEADVTAIARLRERAKAAFEAREGVKLSFLPFFALAAVESLKAHPKLNAVIDTANGQVTYLTDEHLGIAVDTDRGLMVPVIRKAGDLNIAGLARKIADLAARTRGGQVSPDDLAGGTFTLTNTGSRGALFDTPIINQPQVGILGTGTVVKRAVVVEDPALGEVITVRSMVYLALTYDHRLVDGADAARFLTTLKARLEEGAFETELGL